MEAFDQLLRQAQTLPNTTNPYTQQAWSKHETPPLYLHLELSVYHNLFRWYRFGHRDKESYHHTWTLYQKKQRTVFKNGFDALYEDQYVLSSPVDEKYSPRSEAFFPPANKNPDANSSSNW